jgi:hypothetical protein
MSIKHYFISEWMNKVKYKLESHLVVYLKGHIEFGAVMTTTENLKVMTNLQAISRMEWNIPEDPGNW